MYNSPSFLGPHFRLSQALYKVPTQYFKSRTVLVAQLSAKANRISPINKEACSRIRTNKPSQFRVSSLNNRRNHRTHSKRLGQLVPFSRPTKQLQIQVKRIPLLVEQVFLVRPNLNLHPSLASWVCSKTKLARIWLVWRSSSLTKLRISKIYLDNNRTR